MYELRMNQDSVKDTLTSKLLTKQMVLRETLMSSLLFSPLRVNEEVTERLHIHAFTGC